MTLPELRQKVKDFIALLERRDVYTVLLIIVVGFGAFGLGRLSKLEEGRTPLRIEQTLVGQTASALSASLGAGGASSLSREVAPSSATEGVEVSPTPMTQGGQLVASKSGTKYHFPWCSGAQRIAEANKIWFNSVEDARKAGYTPASNCKGLK